MRTRSGRPCTARKGARSNGLAVTGSAQAVGSVNGWYPYHRVVSGQLPDGLTFTVRSHKRAPKLRCVLRSDMSFAFHVALRQPLNGYGVRRARFLTKQLASPPLGGIRQWYRVLFSSAAAAWLSLLSKNAPPECSAGVSRAVNKVFTVQCEYLFVL